MKQSKSQLRNKRYYEKSWHYEVPTYSVLDLDTGRISACNSLHQACSIAFGEDKKIGRQRYLACLRTCDAFICM